MLNFFTQFIKIKAMYCRVVIDIDLGDVVAHWEHTMQTSGAENLSSNPASHLLKFVILGLDLPFPCILFFLK